jgi:hypothetical protein
MWQAGFDHHGRSVFFLLEGAKDNRHERSGNCLFPETLKSHLREVRSTIKAYSKTAVLGGYEEASACGIRLMEGDKLNTKFRVQSELGEVVYTLDRWD